MGKTEKKMISVLLVTAKCNGMVIVEPFHLTVIHAVARRNRTIIVFATSHTEGEADIRLCVRVPASLRAFPYVKYFCRECKW
jgi:hypothetical protein